MSAEIGPFDKELQMFREPPKEPDLGRLRFLRWLAERGMLEHKTVGEPYGEFAAPGECEIVSKERRG